MENQTYYEQWQKKEKVVNILTWVATGLLVVLVVFLTLSIVSLVSG